MGFWDNRQQWKVADRRDAELWLRAMGLRVEVQGVGILGKIEGSSKGLRAEKDKSLWVRREG